MWCISVVKRTSLLLRAASRTPSKPIDARIRLCVRGAGVCPVLPLAARLPSRCSADTSLEVASLFATFLGTMQASDFSPVLLSGVWPWAFPDPPTADNSAGSDEISQFLLGELLRMRRVFDRVESSGGSPVAPSSVWPSASLNSVGTPDSLISRLNGWPTDSPVNASTASSRRPPHDSGSGWLAIPFLYRTFIDYSSTVLLSH